MIWIASYPRSGSTYMCRILKQVYGIQSSVHHSLPGKASPLNFYEYPAVETHILPQDLDAFHRNQPSAYIVRDGRDATVAAARHRKQQKPNSRLHYLMLQAILADEDSTYGGWSKNVIEWIKKADVILRYEDLVAAPVQETEKLRTILDLPQPNADRAPAPTATQPSSSNYIKTAKHNMPKWMRPVFWRHHGHVMKFLGYQKDGGMAQNLDIEHRRQKIHEIFHDYPSRTIGENLQLLLTKYGLL